MALRYYGTTHVVMASYMHYPPVGARDFDVQIRVGEYGFPETWRKTYLKERLYLSDLHKRAVHFTRPYFWTEVPKLPDLTKEEREYLRRASAQNLEKVWAFRYSARLDGTAM